VKSAVQDSIKYKREKKLPGLLGRLEGKRSPVGECLVRGSEELEVHVDLLSG